MAPLAFGCTYHVYTRAINRKRLFYEPRNYAFFLKRYARYISPVADTYAYCLMNNHFHLLIRIKEADEQGFAAPKQPSRQFAHLLNSYAKTINKAYDRTGSLFQRPFRRIEVTSERYFRTLVRYIHHNPEHHHFVRDFRAYPHSSYEALLSQQPTRLAREAMLRAFGGREAFRKAHERGTRKVDMDAWLEQAEQVAANVTRVAIG